MYYNYYDITITSSYFRVDQLQGYKKMSENIFKDTPDFSALNVRMFTHLCLCVCVVMDCHWTYLATIVGPSSGCMHTHA
jgi:hypothetical protein